MLKLLKKLFSTEDGSHTVVIMHDDGSKPSSSYRLNPISLWSLTLGSVLLIIIIVVLMLRFTPLGGFVYNQKELRESVIAIQQRVASLQDTIEARNMQLNRMQRIIATGGDTTMPVSQGRAEETANPSATAQPAPVTSQYKVQRLPIDAVLISNLLEQAPDFPAALPVDGTISRTYNENTGHYGLDIAAEDGSPFYAIANGVIISREWTFNYGYVIVLQHGGGINTVYKHAQTVDKALGDVVQAGDVLGTLGDIGILSSGPHIHIEIWENGIPVDPQNYLINLEE